MTWTEPLDELESTRNCECCAVSGVLPLGRECLCDECYAAECDPVIEGICRRVCERAGEVCDCELCEPTDDPRHPGHPVTCRRRCCRPVECA